MFRRKQDYGLPRQGSRRSGAFVRQVALDRGGGVSGIVVANRPNDDVNLATNATGHLGMAPELRSFIAPCHNVSVRKVLRVEREEEPNVEVLYPVRTVLIMESGALTERNCERSPNIVEFQPFAAASAQVKLIHLRNASEIEIC